MNNQNFFDTTVSEIAKMTNYNDHTGAALWLAKLLNAKEAIKELREIDARHEQSGSMTEQDIKLRSVMTNLLFDLAKGVLKSDQYEAVKGAF